ncbi:hypothetical protein BDQ12DRAFT_257351 [Crucibulum laeve]|uniref:Uncharacterized protein n=1 Tax=Crucibulum laeve TaxID=68775 RepID=A0A5C3M4J6_9AGAR|nr:hypothetical protein BDQ12DRAFT_257351 [Crucibulum laeve]
MKIEDNELKCSATASSRSNAAFTIIIISYYHHHLAFIAHSCINSLIFVLYPLHSFIPFCSNTHTTELQLANTDPDTNVRAISPLLHPRHWSISPPLPHSNNVNCRVRRRSTPITKPNYNPNRSSSPGTPPYLDESLLIHRIQLNECISDGYPEPRSLYPGASLSLA